jgi:hypothetical protein
MLPHQVTSAETEWRQAAAKEAWGDLLAASHHHNKHSPAKTVVWFSIEFLHVLRPTLAFA